LFRVRGAALVARLRAKYLGPLGVSWEVLRYPII